MQFELVRLQYSGFFHAFARWAYNTKSELTVLECAVLLRSLLFFETAMTASENNKFVQKLNFKPSQNPDFQSFFLPCFQRRIVPRGMSLRILKKDREEE